ncbi:MAG: hypothetical protein J5745_00375 [Bacteroidales bacterium]|nr:hypothetical protein [Bacteroidales bacterium]
MKRSVIFAVAVLALLSSCRTNTLPPRPTIALVESIVRDTSGLANIVARAGNNTSGSIAIIGEPAQAVALSRLFVSVDAVDNVDGREVRDSLPDFAGEQFDVILDANNAPYGHYMDSGIDSLREAAVMGAMFAWDSTCLKSSSSRQKLAKSRAKILVFCSPLHRAHGLFDVDTLQQLCGGRSRIVTPVDITLTAAVDAGAANIAVWASRDVKQSGAYESAFAEMDAAGTVTCITPESALDDRTQLRSLLRQYLSTGNRLDALILSDYDIDPAPLNSEINLIRKGGTEEDMAFGRILSPDFVILAPGPCLTAAVYRYMRENNLFTHRIARPHPKWYETTENDQGGPSIIEVGSTYVYSAYVQNLD